MGASCRLRPSLLTLMAGSRCVKRVPGSRALSSLPGGRYNGTSARLRPQSQICRLIRGRLIVEAPRKD